MKMQSLLSFLVAWFVIASGVTAADSLMRLTRFHDYKPGKNSFILQDIPAGESRTLLQLDGCGSFRHLWTTWSVVHAEDRESMAGQVILRVYVDGEETPTVEASLYELCLAVEKNAAKFPASLSPMPAFCFNRSLNLFLPIAFDRGIRVEAEARVPLAELFVQLDYRQTTVPENTPRLIGKKPISAWDSWEYEQSPATPIASSLSISTHESTLTVGGDGLIVTGSSGGSMLRRLTFEAATLDGVELRIYWDDDPNPAVCAPLSYFFGEFTNAAVESTPGRWTTWFPMPFTRQAKLVLSGSKRSVKVSYDLEHLAELPKDSLYFHALFREEPATVGYLSFESLAVEGRGLFVGANLFDTGPNHGGGDTALLDPTTESPRVVHGINGEDYFAFAWHNTGRMNPLTGAPTHERRYRLHLENPYPFTESLRFTFGVFARQHPKSVAFWYQEPARSNAASRDWKPVDAPWNILGPLAQDAVLSEEVDARVYSAKVPCRFLEQFDITWKTAVMSRGFIDLTDHFRHFTMALEGPGFLVGKSVTRLTTWIHLEKAQTVPVRWGHDDAMSVAVNGGRAEIFAGREGFLAATGHLTLNAGWNQLTVTLENESNVNWRWTGLSFAVPTAADLRFALKPE